MLRGNTLLSDLLQENPEIKSGCTICIAAALKTTEER